MCMGVGVYKCVYVLLQLYVFVCVHVHMYVCVCVYVCDLWATATHMFNVLNSRTPPDEVIHNPYINLEIFQTSLEPHHII